MAERAEGMINVLAPRPGGVLAALDAAPEADVLLVAHTGLDHVVTIADIWHSLPMDKRLLMGWWRIPREEIPAGPRGAHRLALRVVAAGRRVGRRAPPGGPAPEVAGQTTARPTPRWNGPSRVRRLRLLRVLDVGDVDVLGRRVRRGDRVRLLRGVGEGLARVGARSGRRRWCEALSTAVSAAWLPAIGADGLGGAGGAAGAGFGAYDVCQLADSSAAL